MGPATPSPGIEVLLIEDDAHLARLTAEYLERQGVRTCLARDGEQGLVEASRRAFDAILIDIMLPRKDGLTVCRELRERSAVPILMLTARGEEADRVMGLELGADDYLPKPYSSRELLARIQALVRRSRGLLGPSREVVRVGALTLNRSDFRASLNGQVLPLTRHEFALLLGLAERAGRVLSREQLLELAKGNDPDGPVDRAIDVHVSRLRQKLGDDARNPRMLKTVRGVGYVLERGEES
ncbi:response regulator transcription factor [Myxococcus sp. CA051A]|uniref:response regulator transcription factor n=1 Tax=unclassified Myxococcus TaxID=2648731 RepID=UPI00157AB8BD|nr:MULTISPECIES: response regulator transcription factor [unclassified Myxococcus]NTX09891.1 response regulator transcription factor [Myxococcus sp. CA056]NTX35254.1 response regulator transcription factor [Myxococcus sp. CA033]NTX51966.1 response regulator transcription factor [Myxococcus sp. CA039A]NTX64353.1 response regulator transcription factor [Myxococcus sp. CA051A]